MVSDFWRSVCRAADACIQGWVTFFIYMIFFRKLLNPNHQKKKYTPQKNQLKKKLIYIIYILDWFKKNKTSLINNSFSEQFTRSEDASEYLTGFSSYFYFLFLHIGNRNKKRERVSCGIEVNMLQLEHPIEDIKKQLKKSFAFFFKPFPSAFVCFFWPRPWETEPPD